MVRIAFATSGDDLDLWKQAYQHQFGSNPDEDMAQYADDVQAWRASWQGGYDAGEEWAVSLVNDADDVSDDEESDSEEKDA